MNKLAEALYCANLAMAASYFLRTKNAAYNRAINKNDSNALSNLATAVNGVAMSKSASVQDTGFTDDEAFNSALYDACKGIIRMRNISQF